MVFQGGGRRLPVFFHINVLLPLTLSVQLRLLQAALCGPEESILDEELANLRVEANDTHSKLLYLIQFPLPYFQTRVGSPNSRLAF